MTYIEQICIHVLFFNFNDKYNAYISGLFMLIPDFKDYRSKCDQSIPLSFHCFTNSIMNTGFNIFV